MLDHNPLLDPIDGSEHQMFGGCQIDVVPAGAGHIKRIIYPPGHRWTTAIKPLVGTKFCQHNHVGFLASGELTFEFPDGCVQAYVAPVAVAVEPGHDAYVVGDEPAVLIQIDFGSDTNAVLGLPETHAH